MVQRPEEDGPLLRGRLPGVGVRAVGHGVAGDVVEQPPEVVALDDLVDEGEAAAGGEGANDALGQEQSGESQIHKFGHLGISGKFCERMDFVSETVLVEERGGRSTYLDTVHSLGAKD